MTSLYSNDLIFGKNKLENIVSVEPCHNGLIVFMETNGELKYEVIENKYWILTNQIVSSRQRELKGDQYYKYIAEFETLEEKMNVRKLLKSNGVEYWDIFNPKEASLLYNGVTYFKGLTPKDVSVLSWDIETVGFLEAKETKVLLISNTFRKNGIILKKLFAYDEYKNQKQMVDAWCDWVREIDPSIILGHNLFGFDFQYMQKVAKLNKTYLRLGRDNSTTKFDPYTTSYRVDGNMSIDFYNANIFGREIVDTMFLARKYDFAKKYVSYGLKPIIEHEGLVKEGRQFYDAGDIRKNYTNPTEWEKIKAYAIDDADDALSLYDLMIPSYFYVTQSVSKSFQSMINSATGSQINNVLIRSYLQNNHSIAKASEITAIKGGISFAVPGIYKFLKKIDIKSCYPSQILRFKLYDKEKDPCANFYNMVYYFTHQRFEYKKKYKETGDQYWKDLDAAAKVFINSAYGVCTTPGLNYNAETIGAKITEESRKVIDQSLKWASGHESDYWFKVFNKALGKEDKNV